MGKSYLTREELRGISRTLEDIVSLCGSHPRDKWGFVTDGVYVGFGLESEQVYLHTSLSEILRKTMMLSAEFKQEDIFVICGIDAKTGVPKLEYTSVRAEEICQPGPEIKVPPPPPPPPLH